MPHCQGRRRRRLKQLAGRRPGTQRRGKTWRVSKPVLKTEGGASHAYGEKRIAGVRSAANGTSRLLAGSRNQSSKKRHLSLGSAKYVWLGMALVAVQSRRSTHSTA